MYRRLAVFAGTPWLAAAAAGGLSGVSAAFGSGCPRAALHELANSLHAGTGSATAGSANAGSAPGPGDTMSKSASASAPSVRPKLLPGPASPVLSALRASLLWLWLSAATANAGGARQLALQARVTQAPRAMKPSLGATSRAVRPRRTIDREPTRTMPPPDECGISELRAMHEVGTSHSGKNAPHSKIEDKNLILSYRLKTKQFAPGGRENFSSRALGSIGATRIAREKCQAFHPDAE